MDKQTREALAQQEALEKEIQRHQKFLDSFDRWRQRQEVRDKKRKTEQALYIFVIVALIAANIAIMLFRLLSA